MIRRDPFVSFGDDQNTAVKFQMVHDGRGRLPDWEGGAKVSRHPIGNSDAEVTQNHGRESRILKVTLLFDDGDAMDLLDTLQGPPATLRLLWGVTSRAGGTKKTIGDTDYLILPDTFLDDLANKTRRLRGGFCTATATFRRPYVASPYVGFTLLAPEDS